MGNGSSKAAIKTIGIDLAKSSFHLYGVDKHGRKVRCCTKRCDHIMAWSMPILSIFR